MEGEWEGGRSVTGDAGDCSCLSVPGLVWSGLVWLDCWVCLLCRLINRFICQLEVLFASGEVHRGALP